MNEASYVMVIVPTTWKPRLGVRLCTAAARSWRCCQCKRAMSRTRWKRESKKIVIQRVVALTEESIIGDAEFYHPVHRRCWEMLVVGAVEFTVIAEAAEKARWN